jgi:hypothetical protein
MRFVGNHRQGMPKGMAYSLIDYCELVNCTGRCIREDKAGYIEQHHSPILACLGLDSVRTTLQHRLGQSTYAATIQTSQTSNVYEGWQRPEPYFNTPE